MFPSHRLHTGVGDGIALATAASSLVLPPGAGTYGDVSQWNDVDIGTVPMFELEIWASAARALSAAELYGACLHPLVYADDTFTAAASNICTNTTHLLATGDGPFRVSNSGGALPGGLSAGTDYYVIKLGDDTFSFATTRALALAGTAVDITDAGTGTHTIADTADTQRVHWHYHGGLGTDGAIDLTDQKSYMVRVQHTPRAFAYAVVATFGAGSGTVSARVYPVQLR